MTDYELKIKKYMFDNGIEGQHLVFEESCHTVEEAARAAEAEPEDLVKNICMLDDRGRLIVAIVKGEDRVSKDKLKKLTGSSKMRTLNADEILQQTGYPCGGVPSFGYEAEFIVDRRVMEKEMIISGGGSPNSLIKTSPTEIVRVNNGRVEDIRQD
ncbi:MAG: aminoacyl-tRNA deacylase [Bacillota bacterium]